MAAGDNFLAEFLRLVIDQGDVSGSWRKWHMEFTLTVRIKTLGMGKVNVGTNETSKFQD